MLGGFAKSLFGSSNDRYVKSLNPILAKIAGLEPAMQAMSDDQLANQTVAVQGSQEAFMSYLTSRFTGWIGAPTTLAIERQPGRFVEDIVGVKDEVHAAVEFQTDRQIDQIIGVQLEL